MDDQMRTRITKQAMVLYEGGITISDIIRILPCLYPKESSENIKMIIENSIEMMKSLMLAVDQAGGSGWPVKELCTMTLLGLISTLAPNKVRFIYTRNNQINKASIKMDDIIDDYKEHLDEDNDNMIAACSLNIYEEIKKMLEND